VRGYLVAQSKTRIAGIVSLARGAGPTVNRADLDAEPWVVNCPNGVVDLRSGELLAHDANRLFTKQCAVPYVPGATHPDWTAALQAIPDETRGWLQARLGDALIGRPPRDDLMMVLRGSGSNGKTTVMGAIMAALGDYATVAPEALLLGANAEHPTVLADLQGCRLVVVEETSEGRQLDVGRLKRIVGTPVIKARKMREDYYEFAATHTMVINTNFMLMVAETDHGTWRRLAEVRFPYTYKSGDDSLVSADDRAGDIGLRDRIKDDATVLEAVLAWLVEGALTSLPAVPSRVVNDTEAWRRSGDQTARFCHEHVVFEMGAEVDTAAVRTVFATDQSMDGHHAWSEQTWKARFEEHDLLRKHHVAKVRRRRKDGARPHVFTNMRLRTNDDEDPDVDRVDRAPGFTSMRDDIAG